MLEFVFVLTIVGIDGVVYGNVFAGNVGVLAADKSSTCTIYYLTCRNRNITID
ncbi:hypothetical protein [Sporomusa silvacetica]|uniref:hypothetical protein n=1 Tax=Sporomusa silvacetica TaxID=55504 RepID=UPI0031840671